MELKDISLHLLDIVQNSITARGTEIQIFLSENLQDETFRFTVKDNGIGIPQETLTKLQTQPATFEQMKKTQSRGLGIPLLREAAEQTGGTCTLCSSVTTGETGTEITATFLASSPNMIPLGNIGVTLALLLYVNPTIHFLLHWECDTKDQAVQVLQTLQVDSDLLPCSREEYLPLKEYFQQLETSFPFLLFTQDC